MDNFFIGDSSESPKQFTTENSCLWFSKCRKVTTHKCQISALAIIKKLQNGSHFVNINRTEKFQTTNLPPPHPPKFGSLVSWVSTEVKYQHQPLWKNWKMALISLILIIRKNFKLLTPQSFGFQFSKCQRKWNISVCHYENIEKWLSFQHSCMATLKTFMRGLPNESCVVLHFLIFQ